MAMQSSGLAPIEAPPFGAADALLRMPDATRYPPCDVEHLGPDRCRISLAVAGFRPDELSVFVEPNGLTVSGRKTRADGGRRFVHRGIALRPFDRRFELADDFTVEAASYADGLLQVDLRRAGAASRPRRLGFHVVASEARAA
jgi:molecular chaperone IbpA